jgi:hypothetical protein
MTAHFSAAAEKRPHRIVQTMSVILMLYEDTLSAPRQIFLNGSELPKEPNPTWLGYPVGH